MANRKASASAAIHRKFGVDLFNRTWRLLLKTRRTAKEAEEMVHAAHASRYHWGRVGTPKNLSIGEWQISRIYAVLGRAEPAVHHARRSLQYARTGRLSPFYVGYAYEALARASAVAQKPKDRARYLRLACRAAESLPESEDRRLLVADLRTIR